jgi:peptidoglycan/xylan/chitin deacetylase (PgdA/CDA1 family)
MCIQCDVISRRAVLAGLLGAAGTLAGIGVARAACWTPEELKAVPGEALRRRPTAADAIARPTPAMPLAPVATARAGIIRRVDLPAGEKAVALTFDLCQTVSPIAGYDGAVVDYLRAEDVPATFFACGRWLLTHRVRAEQLAADKRFLLANHSYDHPDLHGAPAARVQNEILLTEAALAAMRSAAASVCATGAATPPPMRLFRFPYGSCAPADVAAVNAIGSVVIQWDTVSGDPDGTSAKAIIRNVFSTVRSGSIVVMHGNGRGTHTAAALATIIPKLRGEGYRFLTVADLIKAGKPVAANACYITRPGDTAQYDQKLVHNVQPAGRGRRKL